MDRCTKRAFTLGMVAIAWFAVACDGEDGVDRPDGSTTNTTTTTEGDTGVDDDAGPDTSTGDTATTSADAAEDWTTDSGEPDTATTIGMDVPGGDVVTGDLTYHKDVAHILGENCAACHGAGGIGPFPLTTYEEAAGTASLIANAVDEGRMPPWKANTDCRDLKHERLLDQSEIDAIVGWAAAGAPEGDPADAQPFETPEWALPRVDVSTQILDAYTPDAAAGDDYRCLVVDYSPTETVYLAGQQVRPDVDEIVHHVLLFYIPPAQAEAALGAHQADDPGYSCFGGGGFGSQMIGAWVPGSPPMQFPTGAGFALEPGSRLVMQMHYNVNFSEPQPDQTAIDLMLTTEEPEFLVSMPLLLAGVSIEPHDPAATSDGTFTNNTSKPQIVWADMPHMHLLGTEIDLRKVEADGSETCLVDVDDYDFEWQQFYEFEDDQRITLQPGESVTWTCQWDNTAANQPVINGTQGEPGFVGFGEGTLDEMCVHILGVMTAVDAVEVLPCEGYAECRSQCAANDSICPLECAESLGASCNTCFQNAGASCGGACGTELNAAMPCLQPCLGAELSTCAANCPAEWGAFLGCVEGAMSSDAQCGDAYAGCGVP